MLADCPTTRQLSKCSLIRLLAIKHSQGSDLGEIRR